MLPLPLYMYQIKTLCVHGNVEIKQQLGGLFLAGEERAGIKQGFPRKAKPVQSLLCAAASLVWGGPPVGTGVSWGCQSSP